MLIVAPAAARKQRTWRRNALRGGLDQLLQAGMNLVIGIHAGLLTREDEWNQHDSSVNTGQAVAAINPLVDYNFVYDKDSPNS